MWARGRAAWRPRGWHFKLGAQDCCGRIDAGGHRPGTWRAAARRSSPGPAGVHMATGPIEKPRAVCGGHCAKRHVHIQKHRCIDVCVAERAHTLGCPVTSRTPRLAARAGFVAHATDLVGVQSKALPCREVRMPLLQHGDGIP